MEADSRESAMRWPLLPILLILLVTACVEAQVLTGRKPGLQDTVVDGIPGQDKVTRADLLIVMPSSLSR